MTTRDDDACVLRPATSPAPAARSIRRRDVLGFLAGASAAGIAAAGVGWLAPRGGSGARAAPAARTALAALIEERPRLIFAVPTDPERRYQLGRALGEYLDEGTDEQLAPLALVRVECVSAADLGLPAPQGPTVADGSRDSAPPLLGAAPAGVEPVGPFAMVLVTRGDIRVTRFDLPGRRPGPVHLDDDVMDHRIERLARLVRDAVAPGGRLDAIWPDAMTSHGRIAAIAARAARGEPIAIETVTPPFGEHAARDPSAPVTPGEIDRHAPGLYAAALQATGRGRDDLMAMLAGAVRARLVRGTVHGSEWALRDAAWIVEGREPARGMGCTIGVRVPERGRRLLHFYTGG